MVFPATTVSREVGVRDDLHIRAMSCRRFILNERGADKEAHRADRRTRKYRRKIIDAHDREIIAWHAVVGSGI